MPASRAAAFLSGSRRAAPTHTVVLVAVAVVAVGWLRLQRQPLHAST